MTTNTFPTNLPADYGMFTTEGNHYMQDAVRFHLALAGKFLDDATAERITDQVTSLAAREDSLSEATDTMVRDLVFSVLTGRTNAFLGLDATAE